MVRDPNDLTISGSFFLSSQIIFTAVKGHASNSRIFDNQYASWLIGQFKVPLRSIVLNGSFAEPSNFRVVRQQFSLRACVVCTGTGGQELAPMMEHVPVAV